MDDFKEQINREHNAAELERIRAVFDGCGCQICQKFYRAIDLSTYGNRVIEAGDGVVIMAGKNGADLWRKYHKENGKLSKDAGKSSKNSGIVLSQPINRITPFKVTILQTMNKNQ